MPKPTQLDLFPPKLSDTSWDTDDAIYCIERLGLFKWPEPQWALQAKVFDRKVRLRLLYGYYTGALLRSQWEGLDRNIVLEFVEYEIKRVEEGGSPFDFEGCKVED